MKRYLIALALVCLCFIGCRPPNLPDEIFDYINSLGRDLDLVSEPHVDSFDDEIFIDSIVHGPPGRIDLRLPNYVYFQGVIQAEDHLVVAGQVRIVGGLLGAETGVAALYSGAMVTSNPQAFRDAGEALQGGPDGVSTRVRSWREVPNP